MNRVTNRFLNETGRYVPLKVISSKGNRINRNLFKLKDYTDTHRLYDTTTWKVKLINRKGNLYKNYR